MINRIFKYSIVLMVGFIFYNCINSKINFKVMKHKLNFHTQYNQFIICDSKYQTKVNSEKFETTEALNDRMGIEIDQIHVSIECYGHVKGEIKLLERINDHIDYRLYDHIVEGGFEINSGLIQIQDCPNSSVEFELKVKPGKYRVRVYSSNLKGVDIDEDEGDDYYKIEIWPDINMERKVLKRFIPNYQREK